MFVFDYRKYNKTNERVLPVFAGSLLVVVVSTTSASLDHCHSCECDCESDYHYFYDQCCCIHGKRFYPCGHYYYHHQEYFVFLLYAILSYSFCVYDYD